MADVLRQRRALPLIFQDWFGEGIANDVGHGKRRPVAHDRIQTVRKKGLSGRQKGRSLATALI
jgi:hypothetical protein